MAGEGAVTERVSIEHLAEEFIARYRRGELPTITEYVAAHPLLATEIRELFPTLMMLERVSPQPEEVSSRSAPDKVGGPVPKQLGEYRVLREIGRGGMGIVYEAEQLSLGRHVALKVLPAQALLGSNLLTRFQNEARAAARLHHTNIVPVFGVGEDQGIHYYAMQFIQGHGLDEILEELRRLRRHGAPLKEESGDGPLSRIIAKSLAASEFAPDARLRQKTSQDTGAPCAVASSRLPDEAKCASSNEPLRIDESSELLYHSSDGDSSSHLRSHGIYVRSIARIGLQVAEALTHAHTQGVLHRDIKPSNLLLDAHGVVWITDFGLAKQEGSDLTHSGDVVGTLRYLAPERFRGTSDARTDIYGLGVTLYELLTTRPAFSTTDRHHLIHDISHAEPLPPRRVEPRVPRDLETIVLKAMAKEPGRRYATADELAADLRRFLDDQPIAARRTGIVERVWRWCARRPALAGVSLALLVSLAIGLCGVLWQWSRAEQQKKRAEASLLVTQSERERAERNFVEANRHRTMAEHEAERAEANYRTARQAVDELLTMVSEDELRNQPGLQTMRLRLLTRALEYYQGMLAERENDPKARLELAASYVRVAVIKKLTGSAGDAKDGFRKAIDLLETVLADSTDDRQTVLPLVGACNDLALLHIDDHGFTEARRLLDRARALITPLAEMEPNDVTVQGKLATTLLNIGWCISQTPAADRRPYAEEAIALNRQSLAIFRRLVKESPGDYLLERNLSVTLSNIGKRLIFLGRFDEAQQSLEECWQIRQELVKNNPSSFDALAHLASAYGALADVIRLSPRPSTDAIASGLVNYQKMLEIVEPLMRENPAVQSYRLEVLRTLKNIGQLHGLNNDFAAALDARRRANVLQESCVSQDPANGFFQADWALSLAAQAVLERKLEHDDESLASRFRAREVWHKIQEQPSLLARHRDHIIDNLWHLMLELGSQRRLADVYSIALERIELCAGDGWRKLGVASSVAQSILAATRGEMHDDETQENIQKCLDLAIGLVTEVQAEAPNQLKSFVRTRPYMRDYVTLVSLEARLRGDPNNISLLNQRSAVLRQLGHVRRAGHDWDGALELVNLALQQSADDRPALRQRAQLRLAARQWPEAAADAAQVLAQQPNDLGMLRCRAQAVARLEDWQEADKVYRRLWQLRQRQINDLVAWCRVAHELGLSQDVEVHSKALLDLVGRDPQKAHAAVWQIVAADDVARLPDLALELAQRAVELKPQLSYQITQGGIYLRLNRYQDALEALLPARDQPPGEFPALGGFWLAICYHHLAEHEKAQDAYRRALRSWKDTTTISPAMEAYLKTVSHEAKTLLGGGEIPVARS